MKPDDGGWASDAKEWVAGDSQSPSDWPRAKARQETGVRERLEITT